jgi:putative holliday junction resolvase
VTRLIAFDHGQRRLGVAVADTQTGLAFARPALVPPRANRDAAVTAAVEAARREGATSAVVGLPRNMDGTEGPQAAVARTFGDRLAAAGLTVIYVDERLTTWDARERLGSTTRRAKRVTGEIDSAAARLILQDYLDALRGDDDGGRARTQRESR